MARPGQFLLLLVVAALVVHAHGRRTHGRYHRRHDPNDYHKPRGHHHQRHQSTVPSTTPSTTYFPVYDGTTIYPIVPMEQYKDENDVPKADQVPDVKEETESSDKLNAKNIEEAPTAVDRSNVDDEKPTDVDEDDNYLENFLPEEDIKPYSGSINIDEITPIDEEKNNAMNVNDGDQLDSPNGSDNIINDNDLTFKSVDIGSITTPGTIFINGSTPPPDPPRHYNLNKPGCIMNENGRCEDEQPNINQGGLSPGGDAAHPGPDNDIGGDLGGEVASNLPDEIIPSENGQTSEKPNVHGHHNNEKGKQSNKNKTVVVPVYLPGLGSHVVYPGGPVVAQNEKIPAFYIVMINGQATLVKNPAAVVSGTGNNINQGSVVLGDSSISLGDLTDINSGSVQLPVINIGTGGSNIGGSIGVLPQQPIWRYPNIGGLNIGGGFPGASIFMPSIIPNEQPIITEPVPVPVPEPVPSGSFLYPNMPYPYWPSMWNGINPLLPNVNVNLTNPWYSYPAQNVNWPNIINLLLQLMSQVPNVQPPNPNIPGGNVIPSPNPGPNVNIPGINPPNHGGNVHPGPTPAPNVNIPNITPPNHGGNQYPHPNPGPNVEIPDRNPPNHGGNEYPHPNLGPNVDIPDVNPPKHGGNVIPHPNPGLNVDIPDINTPKPEENVHPRPNPGPNVDIPDVNPSNPGKNVYPGPKPGPNVDIPDINPPNHGENVKPRPNPGFNPGLNVDIPNVNPPNHGGNVFPHPNPGPNVEIPDIKTPEPGNNVYPHPNPGPNVNIPDIKHPNPEEHINPGLNVDIPDINPPNHGGNVYPGPNPSKNELDPERIPANPNPNVTPRPNPGIEITIPDINPTNPEGNIHPKPNPGTNELNPEKIPATNTPRPNPGLEVTIPDIQPTNPEGNIHPNPNPGTNDLNPERVPANVTPRPNLGLEVTIPDHTGGDLKPKPNPGKYVPIPTVTPVPDIMRTPSIDEDNKLTTKPTPTYPELVIPMTTPKPNLNRPKPNHQRPGPHEHDPAIINLLNILLKVPPTTNNKVPQPSSRPSPHPHPKENDQLTKLLLEILKKEGGKNDVHKEKVPAHPKPNTHPNANNLAQLLAHLLEGHNKPNLNILLEPGMDESRSNLILILTSLLASQLGSDYAPGMGYYPQYPPLRSQNPLLYFLGHFPCEQSAFYGGGQSSLQRGLWQLLSNMYGMNSIRFDRSAEETDDDRAPDTDLSPIDEQKK